MSEINVAAPSVEPNNQDLLVFAIYRLGGADRFVDVEDVYLKCFELAPQRLAWRTRADLPDYKKCSKALQSVESSTHQGLLLKKGRYLRRLSRDGLNWVRQHEGVLEGLYGVGQPAAGSVPQQLRRAAAELRRHPVFAEWATAPNFHPARADLADLLNCTSASGPEIWRDRVDSLERLTAELKDQSLRDFSVWVAQQVEELALQ